MVRDKELVEPFVEPELIFQQRRRAQYQNQQVQMAHLIDPNDPIDPNAKNIPSPIIPTVPAQPAARPICRWQSHSRTM